MSFLRPLSSLWFHSHFLCFGQALSFEGFLEEVAAAANRRFPRLSIPARPPRLLQKVGVEKENVETLTKVLEKKLGEYPDKHQIRGVKSTRNHLDKSEERLKKKKGDLYALEKHFHLSPFFHHSQRHFIQYDFNSKSFPRRCRSCKSFFPCQHLSSFSE